MDLSGIWRENIPFGNDHPYQIPDRSHFKTAAEEMPRQDGAGIIGEERF